MQEHLGDDLGDFLLVADDALDVVPYRRPVSVEDSGEDLVPQRIRVIAAEAHVCGVGGLPAAIDV